MLKWIKVRQDASANTSTPLDHGKKDEVAKVEAVEAAIEDEEDSGMEREDTPSNIELNHLRKVMARNKLYNQHVEHFLERLQTRLLEEKTSLTLAIKGFFLCRFV